ncbi:MAG: hypothetical protein FWB76_00235 [Oscillospiraceae bacterium]|nr:hypothetical protein [Oscillospiraceae bacterium]
MLKKYFRQLIALAVCAFFVLATVFAVLMVQAVGNIRLHSTAQVSTYDISSVLWQIHQALHHQDQLWLETSTGLAIDPDTLALELLVIAVPREFSANSRATLTLHNQSAPMQLNNDRFEGRVVAPDGLEFFAYIMLYSGGVYRNERLVFFTEHMLGGPFGTNGYWWGHDWNWNTTVYLNEAALPFEDSAVSVRVFVEEEGVEVASFAMENNSLDFSHTFAAPGFVFGEVVGETGLIYRFTLQAVLPIDAHWDADTHVPALRVINAAGDYIELGMHNVIIGF